jgi:hypothetical protein
MKKLMFALIATTAAFVANAQVDTTSAAGDQTQYKTEDASSFTEKEVIPVTDLPALVQEQLKSPDYAGWTVVNAYKKEKSGKLGYAVELKSGAETKWIKFDAQGNKIKEKVKK